MRLDEAISYLEDHFTKLPVKNKEILKKTFKFLEEILPQFNIENLNKLCEIETYRPYDFPGLANSAANTFYGLYKVNPQLEISYLLDVVANLADRHRPWESLDAFSRIAKSCPKQITQANISYLEKTPSDILEICSYDIERRMSQNATPISPIGKIISYFFKEQPKEVDIRGIIEDKKRSYLNGPSYSSGEQCVLSTRYL